MKKMGWVLFFLVFPMQVFAVKVNNLYQATVPVPTQAPEERVEAMKQGLRDVILKLTADPVVLSKNPDIKLALKRADYFVHDYSYAAPSTNSPILMLKINFEPRDIDWVLKKAGVGYWGKNRPLIMVWIAVIRPLQGTEIVGDDNNSSWLRDMKDEATKLGLPIVFPLMDMADISQLSPEDVTTVDMPALRQVGKRYAPDGYLIGTILVKEDTFESRWVLEFEDKKWDSTIVDKNIDEVTGKILLQVTQTLAKQLDGVINPKNPIWLKLQIAKVADQDNLNALVQYLRELNVVKQVQLAQINGDTIKLSVLVTTNLDTFNDKVLRDRHFILRSQDTSNSILIYDWVH